MSLPDFLKIEKEVTGDPQYSMYTLSLKDPASCHESSSELSTKHINGVDHGVLSGGDHLNGELPRSN